MPPVTVLVDKTPTITLECGAREVAGLVAALITAQIHAPSEANGYDWGQLEAELQAILAEWRTVWHG